MKIRVITCTILLACLTSTLALADEQQSGLPDKIVSEKYQIYYKASLQTFKRGKTFVTEKGIPEGTTESSKQGIPKGTLVYPIRLVFADDKHSEADLYLCQDGFGDWQVQRKEGTGFPGEGSDTVK